ncbi:DUF1569 domain-containing protein [Fulvivirga sp.]|uniref:DinB family protein n=1 Tax=Fulvivirga sp. TaxID=1931237 RepID=UPI0032ED0992
MKTIFDAATREELILRIGLVKEGSKPVWGKMNVYQMVRHNTFWNEWILGKGNHIYKQEFLGKIFGKFALKRMIKDEKPFDKNIPTSAPFKVKDINGNLASEKDKWISLVNEYEHFNNPAFIHGFFGKMTTEQIGILVFKHTDHHLRQFGV